MHLDESLSILLANAIRWTGHVAIWEYLARVNKSEVAHVVIFVRFE